MVRQRLSEALYSAGRRTDAGKSFLELANTYEEDVYTSGAIIEWISGELTFRLFAAAHHPFISDFTRRYLSTPESDDHNLLITDPLLREWAKATLAGRSWRDALVITGNVSIPYFRLYLWANSPGVHPSKMRRLPHHLRTTGSNCPYHGCGRVFSRNDV